MTETIIVATAISLLTILSLYLAVTNLRLRKQRMQISADFLQAAFDKELLSQELSKAVMEIEQREIENTDGFVKFLSESREYAFKYIEDTQAKIVEFQKAVEPRFEYFHSYGQVLGENPHTQIVEDIYQEYLKLKTIIPDEQGEKDERNN